MSEQPRPIAPPATTTRKLTMSRPANGQTWRFDAARRIRPLAFRRPPQRTALGKLLRARRIELGWSQDKTAKVLGISESNVSVLERGGTYMSCRTMVRYYTRLGIPINHLVDAILDLSEEEGDAWAGA